MYAVVDLANALFTIPIDSKFWPQFAFTWNGRQYTFTRLPQGYLHSPTICHQTVTEHLDEFPLPEGVQITHCIDNILIQSQSEQNTQVILEDLIRHMRQKGWEVNPAKIQGPAEQVKF